MLFQCNSEDLQPKLVEAIALCERLKEKALLDCAVMTIKAMDKEWKDLRQLLHHCYKVKTVLLTVEEMDRYFP